MSSPPSPEHGAVAPARPPMDRDAPAATESAVVALGCFWGAEPVFGALDGVVRTTVGFAGGTAADPEYASIGGHAEAVRIEYDPSRIHYGALLDRFWTAVDPALTPAKRRYQPLLAPQTNAQAEQARASRTAAVERHAGAQRVEIVEGSSFHPAASHHQKYKLRRYDDVMAAFRAMLPGDEAVARSPAATLANGYAGGHRDPSRLADDQEQLGLPDDAIETLRAAARRHRGWSAFVRSEYTA